MRCSQLRRRIRNRRRRALWIHVHFEPKNPNYVEDFLRVSERLNLTAYFLYLNVVIDAAKTTSHANYPFRLRGFGCSRCHQTNRRVALSPFRGLGEMEFVKKPYNDRSYSAFGF